MTTTSTFSGLDPEGRSSSRILRPPGGGSSFSFGVGDQQAQPARRHKMASNIFGLPEYEPVPVAHSQQTDVPASTACEDQEDLSIQRTCSPAEYYDADDMVEAEATEAIGAGNETSHSTEVSAETTAAAAVPTRRNPPGGKSSLVLG
ncbi:jupiter microtubule associated homolog 1 [Pelodytes ibericus]